MTIRKKTHEKEHVRKEKHPGVTLLKIAMVLILLFALLLVAVALVFIPTRVVTTYSTPYEECVAAGNPILKTYPAKCVWPSGQTVTQIIPGVNDIDSFEDCAAAGYPIMESYPEQCRTPDGKTFVRNITTA